MSDLKSWISTLVVIYVADLLEWAPLRFWFYSLPLALPIYWVPLNWRVELGKDGAVFAHLEHFRVLLSILVEFVEVWDSVHLLLLLLPLAIGNHAFARRNSRSSQVKHHLTLVIDIVAHAHLLQLERRLWAEVDGRLLGQRRLRLAAHDEFVLMSRHHLFVNQAQLRHGPRSIKFGQFGPNILHHLFFTLHEASDRVRLFFDLLAPLFER